MIKRAPLAFVAIFFLAGIALANAFTWLSDLSRTILVNTLATATAALLAGLLFYFYKCTKRYLYFTTLTLSGGLILLALTTGMLYQLSRYDFPDHHVASLPGIEEEVLFLGETRAQGSSSGGRQRFIMEAHRLYADGRAITVTGRMLAILDSTRVLPPPGHVVLVRGKFLHPPGRCNPGEFSYDAYLQRLGIFRVIDVNQMHLIKPAPGVGALIRRQVHLIQQKIRAVINHFIPGDESRAVIQALILGDQSALTDATQRSFQQTGLSHVLAVSGLHVMLVGMLVYQLLGPLCLRLGFSWHTTTWSRTAITLMILCLYMLITGAKASVCRAVLVSLLMIGGALFQRPSSSLNALGAAALVLLIYRPTYLLDVGFQLSFLAVLGILLLLPVFSPLVTRRHKHSPIVKGVLQSVLVTIAATLGTMPALLYHFGYLSFAGILLNIPALPLVAISLMSGLLMLLAALLFPRLAPFFGDAADFFVNTLLTLVKAGSRYLSVFSITPGTVSLQAVAVLFLICLMILSISFSRYRWRSIIAVILCFTLGLWFNIAASKYKPGISLSFFDVGHGDAILITFPNGRHLLVDTGNKNQFVDQAQRVILPYLQRTGTGRLDAVLITHPHRDHAGGLPSLLNALPVGRLIHGPGDRKLLEREYIPSASHLPGAFSTAIAGDTLLIDQTVRVRILSPTPQLAENENLNEHSLVVQILYGRTSFLLMGDAEAGAEQLLLKNYPDLQTPDVIKVAHHGSSTSSMASLVHHLKSSRPQVAIVSVGTAAHYGLPDDEVIARWRSIDAGVHITAASGAIQISSDGTRVSHTWSGMGCKG